MSDRQLHVTVVFDIDEKYQSGFDLDAYETLFAEGLNRVMANNLDKFVEYLVSADIITKSERH